MVEQILVSHSMIEGTDELPYIQDFAKRLEARGDYPAVLNQLTPEELKALGEEFLSRAQPHRKLGRPFFIDKKPGNFSHLGLILLALPTPRSSTPAVIPQRLACRCSSNTTPGERSSSPSLAASIATTSPI
ncbi:MAG: hypothetical protein WDM89_21035 [Rhizomicrobium sp.]